METPVKPKQPSKHQVREYLYARQRSESPPPSPEQIRKELGWGLSADRSR